MSELEPIRTVLIGIGNCASSIVQSVGYCTAHPDDAVGLSFADLGGYAVPDIDFVGGYDVDARKVGKPLDEAVRAEPNCTEVFFPDLHDFQAPVLRAPTLDGVSAHMLETDPRHGFRLSPEPEPDVDTVIRQLKEWKAQVILILLPVGSYQACEFWAEVALRAGCALVNGIPVFLASNPVWASRFLEKGLPILGDDFKAQFGATIVHRAIVDLAKRRGVKIDRTYQLNVGGNTDFLNMANPERLVSKRESKTEAVQSAMSARLDDDAIRVGPSDYVSWLDDRKVAYIRVEGRLFGGPRTNLEIRLEVEDSPNAAAMAVTAIRCARIALDRGLAGSVDIACAFLFKHPPEQRDDHLAYSQLVEFARGQ